MGKHLHDETAEFRLPTLGRHAAEDPAEENAEAAAEDNDDGLEATQRVDPGLRRAPPGTRPPAPGTRRDDDGAR